MMEYSLVKLFFKRKGIRDLLLAVLGGVIGLVFLTFSIQFSKDLDSLRGQDADQSGMHYLTVTKQIGYMNTLGLGSIGFSENELQTAKNQSFIEAVVPVESNQFKVAGSVGPLYTELFLQSVPSSMLDADTTKFHWEQGDEVPLIISNHFYNLLNHGFGPSQGIPPLPKSALKQKSGTLTIRGKGEQINLRCRIVGFSDRVSSILVPQSFLHWANQKYGESKTPASMAIFKVKDPSNPALERFLESSGYSINKEQLLGTKSGAILNMISGGVFGLGCLLFAQSVVILLLLIRLLVAENQSSIQLLYTLGYSKKMLQKSIWKVFGGILLSMLLLSLIGELILVEIFHSAIEAINFTPEGLAISSIVLLLLAIFTQFLLLIFRIRKSIKSTVA